MGKFKFSYIFIPHSGTQRISIFRCQLKYCNYISDILTDSLYSLLLCGLKILTDNSMKNTGASRS
jgi:hypothetical protein